MSCATDAYKAAYLLRRENLLATPPPPYEPTIQEKVREEDIDDVVDILWSLLSGDEKQKIADWFRSL